MSYSKLKVLLYNFNDYLPQNIRNKNEEVVTGVKWNSVKKSKSKYVVLDVVKDCHLTP